MNFTGKWKTRGGSVALVRDGNSFPFEGIIEESSLLYGWDDNGNSVDGKIANDLMERIRELN